jgi:hypothetical protein
MDHWEVNAQAILTAHQRKIDALHQQLLLVEEQKKQQEELLEAMQQAKLAIERPLDVQTLEEMYGVEVGEDYKLPRQVQPLSLVVSEEEEGEEEEDDEDLQLALEAVGRSRRRVVVEEDEDETAIAAKVARATAAAVAAATARAAPWIEEARAARRERRKRQRQEEQEQARIQQQRAALAPWREVEAHQTLYGILSFLSLRDLRYLHLTAHALHYQILRRYNDRHTGSPRRLDLLLRHISAQNKRP